MPSRAAHPPAERLLVVGNGMVATRFVDRLTTLAPGRFAVTVVGAEPRPAYNRVLLSSLLAGEIGMDDLALKPDSFYAERGVTTLLGRPVTALDLDAGRADLSDGSTVAFDRLVLATGSDPIRLPKPGMTLPGVITFRDLGEVEVMARLWPGARAVVIGGGLLGIEAATGLAKAGVAVTLVHLMDRLMERQLDAFAASLLLEELAGRGVEVVLGADTASVIGDGHAEGLRLADGRVLPADLVVCAVGVRPSTALARDAGLAVNRGVVVDDGLQASRPNVHAIGECAEHAGSCYGLVEPGYEQAAVLAARLAGSEETYPGSVVSTNLKVSGVGVFSAGRFEAGEGDDDLVFTDRAHRHYRRFVLRDDRLVGALLFGETGDALWYRDLIRSGTDVSGIRHLLAFGRALAVRQAA
jgi:nitrite reductase (NADH) large subunit